MSGARTGRADVLRLRGRVVLPQEPAPIEAVRVVVRVEDVSRADAPSLVVAESVQDHPPLLGGAVGYAIDVPLERIDPRARYSLSAHVDVSGSGRVERGDLITTQSYPVQADRDTEVDLVVRRV